MCPMLSGLLPRRIQNPTMHRASSSWRVRPVPSKTVRLFLPAAWRRPRCGSPRRRVTAMTRTAPTPAFGPDSRVATHPPCPVPRLFGPPVPGGSRRRTTREPPRILPRPARCARPNQPPAPALPRPVRGHPRRVRRDQQHVPVPAMTAGSRARRGTAPQRRARS